MNVAHVRLSLCALLTALGALALAGWALDIEVLKAVVPGQSTIKINTAICFALTGIGLAFASAEDRGKRQLAAACGGIVAAIGLLTGAQYLSGLNLGIDELLMKDRGTLRGSGHPGRMSPLTVTAWLALGSATMLLALGRRQSTVISAHVLAGYTGFLAFFTAAGYAFGASAFGSIGFYTAIALHTAVGFAVATAAVLVTRADEGWLGQFAGAPAARGLLRQLLLIAFLLPLGVGFLLLLGTGLGLFNAAFGFALFAPFTVLALVWLALRVAHRARADEEEARAREGQLSAFVSQTTAGFAQVDLTGRFNLVNDRFCEIAGRSREELLTLKMQDITHAEDLPANMPKFEAAIVHGTPFVHEKRYVRPDGSIVWVNNSVSIIRKPSGEPYGVLAVSIDVTERRRAEAAVRENEARLRALTDNLPGGMVYQIATGVDGQDRRFLFVSQSHEKLTGVPADEVVKDPTLPYRLILPEDIPALAEAEAESIRTRKPFDAEARFRRTDGQVRWSRLISAPREQPDGSLIWDGIQIDITERKTLEEDLKRLNESLEERVAERTAELERVHEQLRQSQKLEAMGQLTGGVAHDFNNLLTPIIGSLDLLHRKGIGGDREQRLIGAALDSAERAKVLVQRLLAFARRQPLQPGPVRLDKLVGGMAELVASTSGPQIKVVVDVPSDLPPAKADPNQLEMAILNLSVNSRDAMPEGGILTLAARSQAIGDGHESALPRGDYIRFSVSDTGAGMDEETLARAIEPFFSTKGIGKGTGLGLSMVHGLASQLGGAMTLASKRGLGTTVELLLPAAEDRPDVETSGAAGRDSDADTGIVLLVDDEEAVRASTAELLSDLGYTVIEAESAQQALERLDEFSVDIVVTDHLMPGMTGTDLARSLRSRTPPVPALVVSGYAELEAISPDLPRLSKPFRRDELAACLARLRESAAA